MENLAPGSDSFYVSGRSGASSSEHEKGDSERRLTPRTPTDQILLHHGSFRGKLAKKIEAVYGPFVNVDPSEIGPVLAPFLSYGVLQHALNADQLVPSSYRAPGVILLADISGFTRMCEQFAGGGVSLASLIKESRSSSGAVSTDGFASARYRINNSTEAQGVGAEGVRNVLNIYFRRLIEIIEDFQGDGEIWNSNCLHMLIRSAILTFVVMGIHSAPNCGRRADRHVQQCRRRLGSAC